MYLQSFSVENIKCFAGASFEFPKRGDGSYSGWHVILGGNATGKTTLLQAMAAVLAGHAPAQQMLKPQGWVRHGEKYGVLRASFVRCEDDDAEGQPRRKPYEPVFYVTASEEVTLDRKPYAAPQLVLGESDLRGLVKGPYAASKGAWLTCGYGAFRRFSGGAEDAESVHGRGREARIASLFRESVALQRGIAWLPLLYARAVDPAQPDAARYQVELARVKQLLARLLPEPVQFAGVDTQRVYFKAPGAPSVELTELSDGYRSFLALVFDLLRQIDDASGGLRDALVEHEGAVYIRSTGVVLIDEVDLHLHPMWQRTLGARLCEVFPNLQFIVTSHSPFIAQAASPDGLFVLRSTAADEPVAVYRPPVRVGGWRVEQILLSPLFGLTDTRDPETERLLKRHAALVSRRKWSQLPDEDAAELVAVERALAERLTSPGEDVPSLARERAMDRFIDETLAKLAPSHAASGST